MEFVAQVLLEIFAQIIGELIGNALVHAVFNDRPAAQAKANPILAAIGYGVFGATFGLVSIFVLHRPIFDGPWAQVFALIGTVALMGLVASALGYWRRRRGRIVLRIDRFAFGALFGLGFGVVRFFVL